MQKKFGLKLKKIYLIGVRITDEVNQVKLHTDAIIKFSKIYQHHNESVSDFYRRYMNERSAMLAIGIDDKLDEEHIAMDFLQKLDNIRFGIAKIELENEFSLGHNKYPKTPLKVKTWAESLKKLVNKTIIDQNGKQLERTQAVFVAKIDDNKNINKHNFKSKYKQNKNENKHK